ncbi:MAG: ORF6N domain-containing protein [Ignavibacteriales bacterium]|nr:ORF6N domain-containing protein [Ignavibacteriales bacterium]
MKKYPLARVESRIFSLRGQKVLLDSDLATIYGIPTFRLNEAVKRNRDRFPEDFVFQITAGEHQGLTSQIAISKTGRGRFDKGLTLILRPSCPEAIPSGHVRRAENRGSFEPMLWLSSGLCVGGCRWESKSTGLCVGDVIVGL